MGGAIPYRVLCRDDGVEVCAHSSCTCVTVYGITIIGNCLCMHCLDNGY
jgi:hypothetical protein